jgi:hypothetical protein
MTLYHKMQKMVDATVEEFCRRLAEKHADMGLELEDMMAMWKETAKAPKKKGDKPKKKTAYMNFSQVVRGDIKATNPEIKFGEISTEVSRRWKLLTVEEKEKYASMTTPSATVAANPALVVVPKTPIKKPTKTVSPLKVTPKMKSPVLAPLVPLAPLKNTSPKSPKLKLADLKKLCKEKGLSIKGLKTREEFEELLEGAQEEEEEEEEYVGGTLVDAVDDDGILA